MIWYDMITSACAASLTGSPFDDGFVHRLLFCWPVVFSYWRNFLILHGSAKLDVSPVTWKHQRNFQFPSANLNAGETSTILEKMEMVIKIKHHPEEEEVGLPTYVLLQQMMERLFLRMGDTVFSNKTWSLRKKNLPWLNLQVLERKELLWDNFSRTKWDKKTDSPKTNQGDN